MRGAAGRTVSLKPCLPPACLPACSELGGVYDSCNLFLGLGRRERKSQVRGGQACCGAPRQLQPARLPVCHPSRCPPSLVVFKARDGPHRRGAVQALYPWRRVLREMFHHDRQLGQVYCLKDLQPTVVSEPGGPASAHKLLSCCCSCCWHAAAPATGDPQTCGLPLLLGAGGDRAGTEAAGGGARLCAVAPPAGRCAGAAAVRLAPGGATWSFLAWPLPCLPHMHPTLPAFATPCRRVPCGAAHA